ncbi:MAG: cellulase family glycosylhydrolase [Chthonomonadales bacterium]|nr:cellulase family glycosylhydrolase [Chthonomonadales bacterium]
MTITSAALAAAAILAAASAAHGAPGFVTRDGARLMLDGREYRAIGVNAPGLFTDYAGIGLHLEETHGSARTARRSAEEAVRSAAKQRIAFIRFWATGFWPKDMRLYWDDPTTYWARMDEVFALCRRSGVRLVPSIFFNASMWPLLCEEDCSAIADPRSRTYAAMRRYAREIVSRYRDDTNVLAWEICNELCLAADVNSEGRDAPGPGVMDGPWHKSKWNAADSLTTADILRFYADMTAFIKSIDANHLVTSGDAGPRPTSVSLRESFPRQVWTRDTLRQNLASLLTQQPEPLDLLSIHHYGSLTESDAEENMGVPSSLEALRARVRCARAARVPIFVGELGNSRPTLAEDRQGRYVSAAIDLLEAEGGSLAAVWAWHFPWQKANNVTAESHPALMKRIAAFNASHAGPR